MSELRRRCRAPWHLAALGLLAASCGGEPPASLPPTAGFQEIQTRVFEVSCTQSSCHGAARAGDLDLRPEVAYANLVGVPATNPGAAGMLRVAPGDPDASFLVRKLEGPAANQGARMPRAAAPLPQATIDAIRNWIERGAPDD